MAQILKKKWKTNLSILILLTKNGSPNRGKKSLSMQRNQ